MASEGAGNQRADQQKGIKTLTERPATGYSTHRDILLPCRVSVDRFELIL